MVDRKVCSDLLEDRVMADQDLIQAAPLQWLRGSHDGDYHENHLWERFRLSSLLTTKICHSGYVFRLDSLMVNYKPTTTGSDRPFRACRIGRQLQVFKVSRLIGGIPGKGAQEVDYSSPRRSQVWGITPA